MSAISSTTKIGILGGTFNPLHVGHLVMAQAALEFLELSNVVFVPCAEPPHKKPVMLASGRHRLAMLEAAVEDEIRFEVSDIELTRGAPSYTIDTVTGFREMYLDADLYFIIGTDTLLELHLWKDIYPLLEMCTFVSVCRPDVDAGSMNKEKLNLDPPWPKRLLQNVVRGPLIDISSSNIRHRIAEGMSIRYLVHPAVEMYIAEHGLYRCSGSMR